MPVPDPECAAAMNKDLHLVTWGSMCAGGKGGEDACQVGQATHLYTGEHARYVISRETVGDHF